MNRKGIFMLVLAIMTMSLFVYMLFVLNNTETRHLFIGESIPVIFNSYQDAEIDYFNHENIARYSLEKAKVNTFSSSCLSNWEEKCRNNELLVENLKIEIKKYSEFENVILDGNITTIIFNEKGYFYEFLNGNYSYSLKPVVELNLT